MTTQYMPPSSFMASPQAGGYMGYPGKNGGFSFRKRVERVDWRRIASVDVDTIARTLDFTTLQDNIMNLTFCNLESEMVSLCTSTHSSHSLNDHWGIKDDWATTFLHSSLPSAFLKASLNQ